MAELVILHFQPLERYPPILNIINTFKSSYNKKFRVFSLQRVYDASLKSTEIISFRPSKKSWLNHLIFNISSLYQLIRLRPKIVLYFETYSSLPAIIYKILRPSVKLYIHYHEYTSIEEYNKSTTFTKFLHTIEKRIYNRAQWISHTNQDRLTKFSIDYNLSQSAHLFTLANYPPRKWYSTHKIKTDRKLNLVYIGYDLDPTTSYIKELVGWIEKYPEKCTLSIYTHLPCNYLLREKPLPINVFLYGSVSYFDLPKVLKKYDLGLVLYKPHTFNYTYNIPNKFYEYLACKLNVIYPISMNGLHNFVQENKVQLATGIDFEDENMMDNLLSNNFENFPQPELEIYKKFTCENELFNLLNMLTN